MLRCLHFPISRVIPNPDQRHVSAIARSFFDAGLMPRMGLPGPIRLIFNLVQVT
jgi:hypothetical protein